MKNHHTMVSPLRRRSSTSGYKSNKSCQVDTAQTQRELLSAALYGQRLNQLHRKIVFYDEFLAEQDDANGAMTSRYEPLKTSKQSLPKCRKVASLGEPIAKAKSKSKLAPTSRNSAKQTKRKQNKNSINYKNNSKKRLIL